MWDLYTIQELNSNPGKLSETGKTEALRLLAEAGLTDADVAKLQPNRHLLKRFINAMRKR